MTPGQMAIRILRYEPAPRLPIVHFGFWTETLKKWAAEGHLTLDEARSFADGNPTDMSISGKLGFDLNWQSMFYPDCHLRPMFDEQVVRELPDGSKHVRNSEGVIVLQRRESSPFKRRSSTCSRTARAGRNTTSLAMNGASSA